MKIPKSMIGKVVRLTWSDPTSFDADELPTGRSALATWNEHGVIMAVEDGIVTFVHASVQASHETRPRYQGSAVPEELVDSVEELAPKPREGNGA